MMAIYGPIALVLDVAFFFILAHVIMSWLISFQVLNLQQQFVAQLWYGLNKVLEPIYGPIRRFMPDTRPLDLAPLVAIIVIISLRDYILPGILLG
ncbi:YggT family protein [Roseovarius sp. EL26]|uniref:YggT family protein n=1 Tax=Roseovarius sp. EL26 TaxID=2126672 RepID=UPI000EA3FF83|nr:YggT family protein [Roseovarius sp. EL26]